MTPQIHVIGTATQMARVWPARRQACRLLWDAVGTRDDGVLLEVPEHIERDLYGDLYGPEGRSRNGVLASIERDTGEGGAYLLADGASAREVYDVASKLDRARDRLDDAAWGVSDEDRAELQRVVDRLEQRLEQRQPMESSFGEEWVPRAAVRRVVSRRSERTPRPVGAASHQPDTKQSSLGGSR